MEHKITFLYYSVENQGEKIEEEVDFGEHSLETSMSNFKVQYFQTYKMNFCLEGFVDIADVSLYIIFQNNQDKQMNLQVL